VLVQRLPVVARGEAMTITVEELYEQAKILTPVERRRLAELLVQPITHHTSLAERLRAARAQIVASGEPLLDWPELEREILERRGEQR
jgi:hypothetical protein